jgi:hypothetical protein
MLRRSLMFGFLAASLAAATGAQGASLSGTWRVSGVIHAGRVFFSASPVCTFRQSGGQIAGACTGPNATGPASGTVIGNRVSWNWSHVATTARGITSVTNFNGVVISSRMIRGTMTSPDLPGYAGAFTQVR